MVLKLFYVLISIAIATIILLVINQAIKEKNIKQRFYINFIITLSLLGLFLISFLIDLNLEIIKLDSYLYFALPFSGVFIITSFIFGGFYFNRYKGIIKKRRESLKEKLYLVIKQDKNFYLEDTKEGLRGIVFNISKSVIFHDEMLNIITKKLNLQVLKKNYLGSFIENEKVKYHCYYVVMNSEVSGYKKVFEMELPNQKFVKFHEEIIYKIILNKEIDGKY